MPRYRMTVRYDGTDFAGSQIQPGKRTVHGTLKAELDYILKQDAALLFASRTDAGVHADGNVCAFDADLPMPPENLAVALNSRLPTDLEVRAVSETTAGFHPRFDASGRRYLYRIWNDPDVPVDRQRYCARGEQPLELEAIRQGLAGLMGRHSFASFASGSLERERAICELRVARLTQRAALLELEFEANRFLHNMICRLVGALLAAGCGKLAPAELLAGLQEERMYRFKPAPAKGLTLVEVIYPPQADGPAVGTEIE